MDALNFAYWLNGFSEIHGKPPTKEQWLIIQDHLKLVFNKVTPDRIAPICSTPQFCCGLEEQVTGRKIFNTPNLSLFLPSGSDFAKVLNTC